MSRIDLTIYKDRRARAVQRARERNIIIPTFAQMKDPSKIPAKIKEELRGIGLWDVHPRNLFRITWKNEPKASGGGFGGAQTKRHGGTFVPVQGETNLVNFIIAVHSEISPCDFV